ncbi:hypothetical protein C8Q77DRAFT_1158953 [Trametes polyzona]|nr:hypothetical protein C8Q77DRAFT_1158953 [Trametes polyzona]
MSGSPPRIVQGEAHRTQPDATAHSPTHQSDVSRPGRSSVSAVYRAQKRNQFFRTKPCRFFAEPAGCIKGDRCNFIHELPTDGSLPSGLPASTEIMSEGEVESAADSSVQGELSPSTIATSEAPSCTSAVADEPKRNFYPVTWRVVGGGVTLGGKREMCQNYLAGRCREGSDCRYAHPDPNDDECIYGYPDNSLFSPISPISPVLLPYPIMYPILSPLQPYALPALPGPIPVESPPPTVHPTPTPSAHRAKNSLTKLTVVTTVAQPVATIPHGYSPHRVVDGSTLLDREPPHDAYRADWAARTVIRPLSTPPTPMHGSDLGVAKLFAAEMP